MRAWQLLALYVLRLHRQSIRNRAYLTRGSLVQPHESAWQRLFRARDDLSFRNVMALDVAAFLYLHLHVYQRLTFPRRATGGRSISLDSYGILGLTLHYLNSSVKQKTLCQVFGITPPVCSRLLALGLDTLNDLIHTIPECKIKWPKQHEMDEHAERIINKVPGLKRFKVFGVVDGLNLKIASPQDPLEQNAYYNGWKASVFCSQVIVFDSFGAIIWVRSNCPGSWHDIKIARPLVDLMSTSPYPYCILADSGFRAGPMMKDKILVPGRRPPSNAQEDHFARSLITARQAAEWGMRSLQGTFGRLKSGLPEDHEKRAKILNVSFGLHNLVVRRVGINQTLQVFDEEWLPGEMANKDPVRALYCV